jgi:hypothetical protein
MNKNMGRLDRTIRLLCALVIAGLLLAGLIRGLAATILIIIAALLVITTLVGFCPAYAPLKISTKGRRKTGTTTPGQQA